jgi:hypothetical protein
MGLTAAALIRGKDLPSEIAEFGVQTATLGPQRLTS